jgi:hypothetical protein
VSGGEAGQVTGTPDKDYNIAWFTEQCLSNVLRLEQYVQDAERAYRRRHPRARYRSPRRAVRRRS